MDAELITSIAQHQVYDLGLPLYQGIPNGPAHPPYMFSLTKVHGEVVYKGGASSANDVFSMGSHVGTHIDALGHVSRDGVVAGGHDVSALQTRSGGLRDVGIEQTEPIVRRGVLLDVAGLIGVDILDSSVEVTAQTLTSAAARHGLDVRSGDAVLIRTGWTQYWPDAERHQAHPAPGVTVDGAEWLVSRGAVVVGSDTPAFEKTPARGLAVHLALLVDASVQIIEMLDLEAIARAGVGEFLFVALPLKLVGATASPIRPIAIA